jgi:hypothetical protein
MSRGLADGVRDASGVLRTGRARPHPGSRVLPARRGGGSQGEGADSRRGETNGYGVHVRCGTRQTGKDCNDTVGECDTFLLGRSVPCASSSLLCEDLYCRRACLDVSPRCLARPGSTKPVSLTKANQFDYS